MKKKKSLIILGIFFLLFWWNPFFYSVLIFYFLVKLLKKFITSTLTNSSVNNASTPNTTGIVLKCTKCGSILTINHKFCDNCGEAFDGNNVKVEVDPNASKPSAENVVPTYVKPGSFDEMFGLSEDKMVELFIDRELVRAKVDKDSKLIPGDILKRKKIFNIIFSLLVFIYISLIFFHFPLLTYIIGLIILIIFYKLTRKYNLMKYLKKQLKARPSEKVSNIVMNTKTTLVDDTSKNILLPGMIVVIALSLLIFIKPIILYEKTDGGYAVRYYTFGLTNFTSATIPEKHKNESIVSLRGNTFSNMPFLNEVKLPDTIIEIRGQAFKNDKKLINVKLPSSLTYLGGGAFYNCTSLESIEIPDSVTYIGGEAFYNAKSLKNVKLPSNLEEIRGSTFENCTSLESIVIPDSVTRIGGHAFYGNSSLNSVSIGVNSKLTEIGSSAFRNCYSLDEIYVPSNVSINERAFKNSGTEVKEFYNGGYKYYDIINIEQIGGVSQIDISETDAEFNGGQFTLLSVENFSHCNILYEGEGVSTTFTLSLKDCSHQINDNAIASCENSEGFEVFLGNEKSVSFYVYYN